MHQGRSLRRSWIITAPDCLPVSSAPAASANARILTNVVKPMAIARPYTRAADPPASKPVPGFVELAKVARGREIWAVDFALQ